MRCFTLNDNKQSRSIIKVLDIFIESVNFIVISYLLLSVMYAFKTNVLWVLFFATNVWLVQKYWHILRSALGKRILCFSIIAASLLVLAGVFLIFGYFSRGLLRGNPLSVIMPQ